MEDRMEYEDLNINALWLAESMAATTLAVVYARAVAEHGRAAA